MSKTKSIPKTNLVGLRELRENMDTFISVVNKGRSFTVLRKSKPVFKIVPVEEWGDEGEWETVIDFREIDPGGISVDDALKALKKAHG